MYIHLHLIDFLQVFQKDYLLFHTFDFMFHCIIFELYWFRFPCRLSIRVHFITTSYYLCFDSADWEQTILLAILHVGYHSRRGFITISVLSIDKSFGAILFSFGIFHVGAIYFQLTTLFLELCILSIEYTRFGAIFPFNNLLAYWSYVAFHLTSRMSELCFLCLSVEVLLEKRFISIFLEPCLLLTKSLLLFSIQLSTLWFESCFLLNDFSLVAGIFISIDSYLLGTIFPFIWLFACWSHIFYQLTSRMS